MNTDALVILAEIFGKSKDTAVSLILTDRGSGGCKALDRNSEILPSCKLLICKHKDCKGVLNSSGN